MMTDAHADAEDAATRAICQAFYKAAWDVTSEFRRDICRDMTSSAITAYLASMAAAGWVMVRDVGEREPVMEFIEGWISCRAAMLAAPAPDKPDVWPASCKHPNSCALNRGCMYLGCPHSGSSICAQIDAALAAPAPER